MTTTTMTTATTGTHLRRLPRTAAVTDTVVTMQRNLKRLVRTPQLLFFATVQPVMFVLLFNYVFGNAISVPGISYVDYLLPGVFVQAVAFGGVNTAIRILSLGALPAPQPVLPDGQLTVNPTAELTNIDLSNILKGIDGRGITFSSNGDRVFAISRVPDALVVLKNTFAYPGQLNLRVAWVVPLPFGPTEVVAIPRVNASGDPIGDLVAISCTDSSAVVFYDDDSGQVVAQVPSVGIYPFMIAPTQRTLGRGPTAQVLPGVRLFVSAYATGQVVVIDVPDPLDPGGAQIVALIGTAEDTSVSPVSPSGSIFSSGSGYGTPGLQ